MNRSEGSLSPGPCSSSLLSSPPIVDQAISSLDVPLSSSTPSSHLLSSTIADGNTTTNKRIESLCDSEIPWNLDSTLEVLWYCIKFLTFQISASSKITLKPAFLNLIHANFTGRLVKSY